MLPPLNIADLESLCSEGALILRLSTVSSRLMRFVSPQTQQFFVNLLPELFESTCIVPDAFPVAKRSEAQKTQRETWIIELSDN